MSRAILGSGPEPFRGTGPRDIQRDAQTHTIIKIGKRACAVNKGNNYFSRTSHYCARRHFARSRDESSADGGLEPETTPVRFYQKKNSTYTFSVCTPYGYFRIKKISIFDRLGVEMAANLCVIRRVFTFFVATWGNSASLNLNRSVGQMRL